ncbi:hypothetical protein HMI54_002421 [Coelomomyces lativittatus]|nr:hypothetical protein HMI56_001914 [Coelomomyces lativittatus]KAJ1509395.1 hypothetical protein HMI54_002421 [Coelomomyces lativittatus]KAJ1510570.1 hypothetical protein HMI55_006942 [Coelomomyces lativittatus]
MKQLPFQVFCCWNGAVVLNPIPFLKNNVRFRYGNASAGECPGSECTTLCRDFLKYGYRKNLIVPKFKVAYNHEVFKSLFSFNSSYHITFQMNLNLTPDDDTKVQYVKPPSTQLCQPLLKNSTHDPDAPSYFEDLSKLLLNDI